jgi:defect in organelle trafficking protein DotB
MTDEFIMPEEPTRFTHTDFNRVLSHCNTLETSDITIQTDTPIFGEIFGRLRRITKRKLNNTEVGDILNAIYGPNGTAQILTGVDIDTYYEYRPSRIERYRYRVNATGCLVSGHDGIQLTLRTIPTTPPRLDDFEIPEEILANMAPEDGIVYVTGGTGSGKSTLLAAIIRKLIEEPESHRKVLTYESPIEFVYDDVETISAVVSQSEIPRHLPTFAAGVRNALRRKPRLILVGESRDAETISASLDAALTGHPVYTTLHTNGVAETIRRLVTTYPADERHGRTIDILETIRLAIWQKLVPTVDDKRCALREYLVFDEATRDELLECEPENVTAQVRKVLKKRGRPMIEDAKEKFAAGIISERTFNILQRSFENADKDAAIGIDGEG